MHINFTNHAKGRIDERNISILHIERTLKTPDTTSRGFDGTSISRKAFGGKILEIVYTESKKGVVVITAYYL